MAFLSKIIQLDQTQFTQLLSGQSISQNGNTVNSYNLNTIYSYDKFVPEWSKGADMSIRSHKSIRSNISIYSKYAKLIYAFQIGTNTINYVDYVKENKPYIFQIPLLFHSGGENKYKNQYRIRYSQLLYFKGDINDSTGTLTIGGKLNIGGEVSLYNGSTVHAESSHVYLGETDIDGSLYIDGEIECGNIDCGDIQSDSIDCTTIRSNNIYNNYHLETGTLNVGGNTNLYGTLHMNGCGINGVAELDVNGTARFYNDLKSEKLQPYSDNAGNIGKADKRFASVYAVNYHGDYFDGTADNASTADMLSWVRTIWGQSFNGSANVSGNMSSVGNITSSSNNTYSIGTSTNKWKEIYATTFHGSLDGNASTSTKLATTRTIWGQSFDGTTNVSGDMSSVGNISFSATGKNIGGIAYFDTTNSRLGIGTSSPSYTLHVYGDIYSSGSGYIRAASGFIKNGSSDSYVLLGGGGHHAFGNSSGNIPVSNGTVCSNLNADMVDGQYFIYSNSSNSPTWIWGTDSNGTSFLASRSTLSVNYATTAGSADLLDGFHASGLFTTFTNVGSAITATIGGVTKTFTVSYATNANLANYATGLCGGTLITDLNSTTLNQNRIYYHNNTTAVNNPNTAGKDGYNSYGIIFQISNQDNPSNGTSQHWINQLDFIHNGPIYYRQRINTDAWGSWQKIITSRDLPVGVIMMWPSATPPTNWLMLNGQTINKSDYPELFDILGITASSTVLPDFRSKFPLGAGSSITEKSGTGNNNGSTKSISWKTTGGESIHNLSVYEIPSHNHSVNDYYYFESFTDGAISGYEDVGTTKKGPGNSDENNRYLHYKTHSTANTGGGYYHNNLPPYIGVYFIIKAK